MIDNCNRINDSRISKVMNHFINNFSDKRKKAKSVEHLTQLTKKIFLMIFLALLILPVVSALVGTDESKFSMAGCWDKTLLGRCSPLNKPGFCTDTGGVFNLTPNCGLNSSYCACPPEVIVCGKNRDCTAVENRKGECESHDNDLDNCITLGDQIIGGVCFWNSTGECKACPDLGYFDCSYYTNNGGEAACELDSCFLGKSGLGVGIYESEVTFVNYYCEWNATSGCALSYNMQDPAGNKCNCRTTQKLSECIDDEAALTWTKVCVNTTAEAPCVTSITQPRTTTISCGKATSPLPFFSFFNFVAVLSFLLVYYVFKIKKEGKKK